MATLATDRKASLQKQIEALQQQMLDLNQEAVQELKLKLSDARKVVTDLENELEELTGKSTSPRAKRERRPKITDEALMPQVHAVMSKFGAEGMNAKQLAEKLNVDALRIRKFIKDNAGALKRQGNAAGTKFFLP